MFRPSKSQLCLMSGLDTCASRCFSNLNTNPSSHEWSGVGVVALQKLKKKKKLFNYLIIVSK